MLIVPIHGARKDTPQAKCSFGQPVFWRPAADQLEKIEQEWELYRLESETARRRASHPPPRPRRYTFDRTLATHAMWTPLQSLDR